MSRFARRPWKPNRRKPSDGFALEKALVTDQRFRGLTLAHQAVLQRAAVKWADRDDRFQVKVKTWADELGISPPTLKRALREAVETGLLVRQPYARPDGRQGATIYTFTVRQTSRITGEPPCEPDPTRRITGVPPCEPEPPQGGSLASPPQGGSLVSHQSQEFFTEKGGIHNVPPNEGGVARSATPPPPYEALAGEEAKGAGPSDGGAVDLSLNGEQNESPAGSPFAELAAKALKARPPE